MVNLSKTTRSSVLSVSIDVLSNVTIGAKISRGDQPKKILTRQETHLPPLSAIKNTINKP